MEIKNQSYCPLPFDTVYSNNTGVYDLCCWSDHSESKEFFGDNARCDKVGPFDFFLSAKMEQVRNKMLAGQKIDMCSTCYRQEQTIGQSVRTKLLTERTPNKVEKINLRIRNFGNHCNLSCVMCIPYNSTSRYKELTDIGYSTKDWGEHPGVSYKSYELFKEDLIKNAKSIGTLSITGGEPFAIPKFWKFLLDDMPREMAREINLHIETNLTNLKWKNYKFTDLVNRYNQVRLLVSCDHFGEKLSFIRYPIDVEQFENNLLHYHRYIDKLTLTVQLLNVFDLDQIKKYYREKFDLDVSTFSYVMETSKSGNPDWNVLSVRNIKDMHKQKIIEKYSHYNSNDKNFFSELGLAIKQDTADRVRSYLDLLSEKRQMNWNELWKDLHV